MYSFTLEESYASARPESGQLAASKVEAWFSSRQKSANSRPTEKHGAETRRTELHSRDIWPSTLPQEYTVKELEKEKTKSVPKNNFAVYIDSVFRHNNYQGVRHSNRRKEHQEPRLTCRDNNDNDQDDDANDQAHAHLHVLPPHLLPHTVGTSAESLCRYSQVVRLVLKGVKALSTLRHLVDILAHHPHGIINLLQPSQHCYRKLKQSVSRAAERSIFSFQSTGNSASLVPSTVLTGLESVASPERSRNAILFFLAAA